MSIGQKFKALFGKLRGKTDKAPKVKKDKKDAELSAEEVISEEVFPQGKRTAKSKAQKNKNSDAAKNSSGRVCRTRPDNSEKLDRICQKVEAAEDGPSKKQSAKNAPVRGKGKVEPTHFAGRNRPTNGNYEMIDPSNESADTGKS